VALIALGVLFEWLSRASTSAPTLGFAVERAPIALRFSTVFHGPWRATPKP
jgi:hypothetical protein